MNQNKSGESAAGQPGQESEADKARRESGVTEHSSHEHMAREKAGKHEGAGGGAKQKEQH